MDSDEPETAAAEEVMQIMIERDSSFVRIAADVGLVIDRTADLELALIAAGPAPSVQNMARRGSDQVVTVSTEMMPSFAEVCRVRMGHGPALNTAMAIVENAIAKRRLDTNAFRAAVDALLEQYAVRSEGGQAGVDQAGDAE